MIVTRLTKKSNVKDHKQLDTDRMELDSVSIPVFERLMTEIDRLKEVAKRENKNSSVQLKPHR